MGRGRQPCCDKSKVKKGPWSPAEDLKLITYIQKHGHDNWRALPARAGLLRCGKSCRLRWVNYLRPDVKRGNFTKEEENLIIHFHEVLGNKWSKIACHFPGRTDNEIKNVWNTHLKRRAMIDTNASKEQSSNSNSKESTLTSSSLSSSASFNSNRNQVGVTGNEYSMDQVPLDKNSLEECPRMSHYSQDAPGFRAEVPIHIIPGDDKEEFPSSLATSKSNVPKISQADFSLLEDDMDSLFDWGPLGSEVRFETDSEFWNGMELDNLIGSFQFSNEIQEGESETYQPCQSSKAPVQSGNENVDQQWFRYLENELGLDSSSASQNNGAITSPDQQLVAPNHFDALVNPDIHSIFPDFVI